MAAANRRLISARCCLSAGRRVYERVRHIELGPPPDVTVARLMRDAYALRCLTAQNALFLQGRRWLCLHRRTASPLGGRWPWSRMATTIVARSNGEKMASDMKSMAARPASRRSPLRHSSGPNACNTFRPDDRWATRGSRGAYCRPPRERWKVLTRRYCEVRTSCALFRKSASIFDTSVSSTGA